MGKPGDNNGPSAELKAAIDSSFGSLDKLKTDFGAAGTNYATSSCAPAYPVYIHCAATCKIPCITAAGRFGSGWAWLGVKADGSLTIGSTPNQDNPMMGLADQV